MAIRPRVSAPKKKSPKYNEDFYKKEREMRESERDGTADGGPVFCRVDENILTRWDVAV